MTFAWLGVASQPGPWIVLIHGGESTSPKLQAALPGANVVVVYRAGSNTGYDEATGIAKEYPTLRGLLTAVAPGWSPGTPLIVMGYSAGGWALRYYLRDASARGDITTAVFLDSLYGAPNNQCDLSPYQGVITYGKEANASPASKRLIMTYSQGHPAPGICSQTIAKAVGGTGTGVFVIPYANGDHAAQQGVAGPAAIKEYVAPWLSSSATLPSSSRGSSWLLVGAAIAAVGTAIWWGSK